MKIKFDTATISESEATGVIALLMELYPNIGAPEDADHPDTPVDNFSPPAEKALPDPYAAIAPPPPADDTPPEHDANGRPWDARIHSTPAKQNADGTWRAKRGVAAELVAEVEAELAGSPTDELDATEEEVKALIASEPELADEVDPAGRIEAAVTATPPPPPPAPAVTFPVVMKKITDNKILPARVQELLAPFGIKSVGELLKPDRAADLVKFNAEIDKELAQ